ncbi:MAG: hypothetical protein V1895_00075, partial [Parcubacteria group bacterium]
MSYFRAGLNLFVLLALTTVLEFSGVPWAGIIALALTTLLVLHWIRAGQQRWILFAAILLSLLPETQSTTIAGLQLHHLLAFLAALSLLVPWIILRPWPLPRLNRLLLTYLVVAAALTLAQFGQIESWHRTFTVAFFVLIALLLPFAVRTKRHLHELVIVLVGGTVLSVIIGLAAYYHAGETHTFFSNPYLHISTVEGVPRLAATFLDSNFLGHQLLVVLPILYVLVQHWGDQLSRGKRTTLYLITTLLTASLFLTYSRSAYLGFAAGLAVLLLTLSGRVWRT